jgi:hypothetical protein
MINASLTVASWRERLQREGGVQVLDYLQSDAARKLHACLS